MRFLFTILQALAGLLLAAPAAAQSPALNIPAASLALRFWTSVEAQDASEKELVADDATFGMMGLGSSYDNDTMKGLASLCDLVGMRGSEAKDPNDPTSYVWLILECNDNGKIETVPLGLGIREDQITQVEVDVFYHLSIDR